MDSIKLGFIILCVIAGLVVLGSITVSVIDKSPTLGIANQVEQVRSAVVHISKGDVCQGSGCLITPDGILFTAKHISDGEPGDYTITLDNGQQYPVKYVI